MKKKTWIISILVFIIILLIAGYLCNPPQIKKINLSDEISEKDTKQMIIEIKTNNPFITKCRINKGKWVNAKNNKCYFDVKTDTYEIEVKNLFNVIKVKENIVVNGVKSIALESKKIYLALGEKLKLHTIIKTVGEADETLKWKSFNNDIVSVEDGIITGNKVGTAKIAVYAKNNREYETEIIVTDLIVPMEINNKKKTVPCNHYTEEEAAILDDILKTRIETKGEGTRAALIEAIRFLTLSFEYKVPYFFESGRLANYGTIKHVDGEGRYYKKGLYLSESKKKDITATFVGPAIWGCPLTNYDDTYGWGFGVKYPNGLDCSGFVTWALLNSGIDVGDIGAGITPGVKAMNDVGETHQLTYSYVNKKEFKVGDIIARNGHTALIAGIDDEYIYIAESLLKGVRIEKFSYKNKNSKLYTQYSYINTLDEVYNGDGIYNNMW